MIRLETKLGVSNFKKLGGSHSLFYWKRNIYKGQTLYRMLLIVGVERSFSTMNRLCSRLCQRLTSDHLNQSFVADCTRRARDYNQSSIARNHISLALSASTPDSATSNIYLIHNVAYTVQTSQLAKFWFTFLPVLFWFSMVVSDKFLWFDFDLMVLENLKWKYEFTVYFQIEFCFV